MSSRTISPAAGPARSTSTPATASTRSLAVRRKQSPLSATPVTAPTTLTLADGARVSLEVGDWVIAHGDRAVDLVRGPALTDRYELIAAAQLTLPPATCQTLEKTLGLGATQSPERLVTAVERLASIHIGDIRIEFTPGQLEEIAHRAQKRGRPIAAELKAVVDRIKDELFWRG